MPRSVLVVHASRYGQTQKIASRIADVAEQEGAEVRVYDVGEVPPRIDLSAFDVVVLAGGIAWGKHPRSLRRFIVRTVAGRSLTHSILVSVSGAAESDATRELAESYVHRLYRETGWCADSFVLFGGGVTFTRYGPFTRWMIRRMQLKNGRPADVTRDYDYTDWEAVDRFARSLAVNPDAVGGVA